MLVELLVPVKVYNTLLLTVVIMLCLRYSELITESLYHLTNKFPFSLPMPCPRQPPIYYVSVFKKKISDISESMQYLFSSDLFHF